jgi:hypothetical protein
VFLKFHYIQFEETYTLYEMRIPEIDTSWFIVLLYGSSLLLVYFRGYPSYREELNQFTYAGEPTQTEPTGAESLLKEPFEVFRECTSMEVVLSKGIRRPMWRGHLCQCCSSRAGRESQIQSLLVLTAMMSWQGAKQRFGAHVPVSQSTLV